jgi:uncharacterized protein
MAKSKPLSRTAARVQGAIAAYLLPKLALDAAPKLLTAMQPLLLQVNRKNLKEQKPAILKLAKDAAMPMMTPEAKAGGGVGPDDVIMRVLDMVEGQVAAEEPGLEEGEEQHQAAVAAPGEGMDATTKAVMDHLRSKGMDEAGLAEVAKLMGGGKKEEKPPGEDEESEEEKARKAKEAHDDKGSPMAGKPAGMDEAAVKTLVAQARKDATADTMKTLGDIRVAEKAVRPLIGEVSTAMDSADAIYAAALKASGVAIDGVHPSAFPALVAMAISNKTASARPPVRLATDAASVTDREAFDKAHNIPTRRVRHLGAA